ncbi:MAG: siroheme synthase CysG [Pseudomonadota bacterium]
MRHFPVYLDTQGRRIVVSGAGDCAVAKLRLLLKTQAEIHVFATQPHDIVEGWAKGGRLILHRRALTVRDLASATLLYAANDAQDLDLSVAALGRAAGVKTLVVDNLEASDFITPAIVDRDPVTVAIGTEGAAPVLARKIKAEVEEILPQGTGILARIGQHFRDIADVIPQGARRRAFWTEYYFDIGPKALAKGRGAVEAALHYLLADHVNEGATRGHVTFVGAGLGDPELLTLKGRKALHEASVVIHDGLVAPAILELARREATIISVAKSAFGPSWTQADINALLVEHGVVARVVRLKSGDGGTFGRLDEEIAALDHASVDYDVVPGITAATAAAAEMCVSLTQRGRNSSVQFLTGRDVDGFADHDWRRLAEPGAVAAIYMARAGARYVQGRLLMHGASPGTTVSAVFNASRPDQRIVTATLAELPDMLDGTDVAILFIGLAPNATQPAFQKEASHA